MPDEELCHSFWGCSVSVQSVSSGLINVCLIWNWDFCFQQIYPSWSHKVEHFQKILQSTDIPYKDMLFFDDEDRNIRSVRPWCHRVLFYFIRARILSSPSFGSAGERTVPLGIWSVPVCTELSHLWKVCRHD